MNLELTEEEAAFLLRELDHIIDGDRYFLVAADQNLEGDPREDQTGAGTRAAAAAAQALYPAACEETALRSIGAPRQRRGLLSGTRYSSGNVLATATTVSLRGLDACRRSDNRRLTGELQGVSDPHATCRNGVIYHVRAIPRHGVHARSARKHLPNPGKDFRIGEVLKD